MEYLAKPNLILESLLYLCARADGQERQRLEEHFRQKSPHALAAFQERYASFEALKQELDRRVAIAPGTLTRLFSNLEGFPYHMAGVYSPAFLLLAPAACRCCGDSAAFWAAQEDCTSDEAAQDILTALDLTGSDQAEYSSATAQLIDSILSMSLPAETRLALLELHKNYRLVMQESVQCLYTALAVLEDMGPKLQALIDNFIWEIDAIGTEAYTQEISNFHIDPNVPCRIQPLLMLPVTYLFINTFGKDGHLVVYCGILRYALRNMELSAEAARNQIYESIRLLGDRTRFDIFCYLKDHPAYGQELSSHFGLARNTIHYHMRQLFKARLVRCTVEGAKTYYSIDKDRYSKLLELQRQFFLHDYQTQEPLP